MQQAHKQSIWITSHHHARVHAINKQYLEHLNAEGNKTVRIIALINSTCSLFQI